MDVIYTIWLRSIKRYLRSKSRMIGSLGMPFFFLIIIGFGLNSVVNVGGSQGYIGYIIPGIVSMTVMFTSVFSGIQIIWDKQFGFLKETLVAPVSRLEIMLGQTVGGATTGLIQGLIMLIFSLLVGLKISNISGILIALVFMTLIGLAFTAFGVAIASKMNDMHGFQMIMNFVIFPIFGLSGALFPLDNLPPWLRSVTMIDPLTYGVDGIRYGLLGESQINPILSFIVLSSFTIVMIVIGAILFRKIKS